MFYSIVIVLFVFTSGILRAKTASLCAGPNATSEPVLDFCFVQNGTIEHRCCISSDDTILAADLTEMNLTSVPDFTQFENILPASVIDLRDNPLLQPSPKNDFLGMQSLDYLLLPKQFDCPGGDHVWIVVNTSLDMENRCLHQKDFCVNATETCPASISFCNPNGPNNVLCLCKSGYHGYKCLRRGNFPTSTFLGVTGGVTVVTSALLYWTQRRHVR